MYGMKSKKIKVTVKQQSKTYSWNFLKKHKSTDIRSHTSIAGGSYIVPPELIKEFHDEYAKDIEEGNHCYLTEVPGKISPIKVDIDMRWESESLDRLYDLDSLLKIVEIYYSVYIKKIN